MIPVEKITEQILQERFDLLSDKLKDAASSQSNLRIVSEVCRNHRLHDEEKMLVVQQITALALLGFMHTYDVGKEINEALNFDNPKLGNSIAQELEAKIFAPVKSELEINYKPLDAGTVPLEPTPTEEAPKIFQESGESAEPQTTVAPAVVKLAVPAPAPTTAQSAPAVLETAPSKPSPIAYAPTPAEMPRPAPSIKPQTVSFPAGWSQAKGQGPGVRGHESGVTSQASDKSRESEVARPSRGDEDEPPPTIIHTEEKSAPPPRQSNSNFTAGPSSIGNVPTFPKVPAPARAVLEFGPKVDQISNIKDQRYGMADIPRPPRPAVDQISKIKDQKYVAIDIPLPKKSASVAPFDSIQGNKPLPKPPTIAPQVGVQKSAAPQTPRVIHYSEMRTALPPKTEILKLKTEK